MLGSLAPDQAAARGLDSTSQGHGKIQGLSVEVVAKVVTPMHWIQWAPAQVVKQGSNSGGDRPTDPFPNL
eukprot:2064873-Pyramimonas_sp.AAC.1